MTISTTEQRFQMLARRVDERGSIVVEVAVLAPLVVVAMLFIAWSGSQRSAEAEAMATARAAARAAAIEINPTSATSAGQTAGTNATDLTACADIAITVDTSEWDDGYVTATAVCTPGSTASTFSDKTITRTWTETVGTRGRIGR